MSIASSNWSSRRTDCRELSDPLRSPTRVRRLREITAPERARRRRNAGEPVPAGELSHSAGAFPIPVAVSGRTSVVTAWRDASVRRHENRDETPLSVRTDFWPAWVIRLPESAASKSLVETVQLARVGWPGASQPPAPSDPGVTVSRHRALLIGPNTSAPSASGRTARAVSRAVRPATSRSAFGCAAVCISCQPSASGRR
jgi:hypothetical protein